MRMLIAVLLLSAACGGREEVLDDRDAGLDAGLLEDAGNDAGSPDAGALDAGGGTDAGGDDAGAELDGGLDGGTETDAGGDAGSGTFTVSLVDTTVGANCMPIVAEDPFNVFFTVEYDNDAGSSDANASVAMAKLSFASGDNLELTVAPDTVGPIAAGTTTRITHTKTASTPTLGDPCSLCDGEVTLELQLDLGGRVETLTSPSTTVGCVY